MSTALGQAALSPTASASQQSVLNSFQNLASTISNLSSSISGLRDQVDQQVASSVSSINSLIKQIYDLNTQVKNAQISGDSASAVLDQRDVALQSLSQLVGIRTIQQPDGSVIGHDRRRHQSGRRHLRASSPTRRAPATAPTARS